MRRPACLVLFVLLLVAACGGAAREPTAPPAAPSFTSERIRVEVRGEGPDVILVHGLGAHRDTWSKLAGAVGDRCRLHFVQLNGFAGFPPGPNAEGRVAAPVAEELARYIEAAGLTRPAVIGHSMGGTIGLMLAARHPTLVGRLMVVDQVPFGGVLIDPNGTAESVRPAADQVRAKILADTDRKMLGALVESMTRDEAARPVLLGYAKESDLRTVANALHELFVTDLRPELGKITAPITVVYVQPATIPLPKAQFDEAVRRLYAGAPSVKLVRFDEANHYLHLDQPERFVTEVDAFLR